LPMPDVFSITTLSEAKNILAPPHLVFSSIPISDATYEPDCTSRSSPSRSSENMSPGSAGATVTSPPCGGAVKVFMKKLSPPKIDLPSDFMIPPAAFVSSVTPGDMLTIAPPST